MSMGWSPEDAAVEAGEGEAAPEVLGEVMGEEEIAMEEGVTGEVVGAETVPEPEGRLSEQQPGEDVGAETVPEPGGRLPEQQPGDWLSLENGRCGAVKVVATGDGRAPSTKLRQRSLRLQQLRGFRQHPLQRGTLCSAAAKVLGVVADWDDWTNHVNISGMRRGEHSILQAKGGHRGRLATGSNQIQGVTV